jgi:hypothetical protein
MLGTDQALFPEPPPDAPLSLCGAPDLFAHQPTVNLGAARPSPSSP